MIYYMKNAEERYIMIYIDGEEVSTTSCSIPFEPWSGDDNLIISPILCLMINYLLVLIVLGSGAAGAAVGDGPSVAVSEGAG